MTVIRKEFAVTRQGDLMVASTPSFDRANDRVFPLGGQLQNYYLNPVVMWGHNYADPWAIVGRAEEMQVTQEGIQFRPVLRPAANEFDPQNIIALLWEQDYVRTSSIGFRPLEARPNERGGVDYTSWELLEVSLTGIPMNQDALRLAVKSLGLDDLAGEIVTRAGRVLSRANEGKIRAAHEALGDVLAQLAMDDETDKGKGGDANPMGTTQSEVIETLSRYFDALRLKVKGA